MSRLSFAGLWPRGCLDIGWLDLLYAAVAPCRPRPVGTPVWPDAPPHLVTLSVRTAWDALLSVHAWPAGSEVICSEANIPDMVGLISAYGLVPVAVPLDPATLAVNAEGVARRITARTRAILISPLFGSRMNLGATGALARAHGVLLVEDNAQAYAGPGWHGSLEADVSMFSFGLIKTCTALGGAVVFVRDPTLTESLEQHLGTYPKITAGAYYYKWARAVLLHALSQRPCFGLFRQILETCGLEPDTWLSRATRGFQGTELLKALRRQPHHATVQLLRRRLGNDTDARLEWRTERGRQSIAALPAALGQLASQNACWALPVRVPHRDAFAARARAAGFDLTHRASSLRCHGDEATPLTCALDEVLYLPITTPMPEGEWQRLLSLVRQATEEGKIS